MIEQTLVLLKPDAVQRGLVGEIIKRFEQRGLKIAAIKMLHASRELAEKHYPESETQIGGMGQKTLNAAKEAEREKEVKEIFGTEDPFKIGATLRKWLVEFLISGPIIAMIVEGKNGISIVRKICGFTDPAKAELGSIRGDFAHTGIEVWNLYRSAVKNLVHASGNKQEAEYEISLWFKPEEIYSYSSVHDMHV
ncbi:nucleoside-diphosphate kinase [archaeon]|nr:nucleoside-diphosphate kinase [archaeon]